MLLRENGAIKIDVGIVPKCSLDRWLPYNTLVMGRCRYLKSVSVFRYFFSFFKVGSVLGIGISKHRDIGIGIRYFPRLQSTWTMSATGTQQAAMRVQLK